MQNPLTTVKQVAKATPGYLRSRNVVIGLGVGHGPLFAAVPLVTVPGEKIVAVTKGLAAKLHLAGQPVPEPVEERPWAGSSSLSLRNHPSLSVRRATRPRSL